MHRGEHRQDLLPNPEAFDPAGIEIAPSLIRCATLSHASKRASQLPLLGPHSPDTPNIASYAVRRPRRESSASSIGRRVLYATEVAKPIGSTIEGSSFSGLLTRVQIGHIRIGSAGNGSTKSRGSGSSLSQRV